MTMIQLAKSGLNYELRGEGMANFVIGFIRDGRHVVWRIRKDDLQMKKNGYYLEQKEITVSVDECQLYVRYVKEFILPLLGVDGGKNFVILPTPVYLNGQQLLEIDSHLKIISLSDNGYSRYSFETTIVCALEMPDFTRFLPSPTSHSVFINDWCSFPVIGVEIKPKQGFIPEDLRQIAKSIFGNDEIAYCTNCLSQYERCLVAGDLNKLYDYCPLDLYSGDRTRMRRAFDDLLANPKTHLRIVCDGQVVMDKNRRLTRGDVSRLLFNDSAGGDSCDFIDCLIRVLLNSNDPNPVEGCVLPKGCVLDVLLQSQRADQLGPMNAGTLIEDLQKSTEFILDSGNALMYFFNDFQHLDDQIRSKLKSLRQGLLAHTMRDCSIMITMQVFQADPSSEGNNLDCIMGFRPIHLSDRLWLKYNVTIVDLDAKTPLKVWRFYTRLIEAMRSLKEKRDKGTFMRIPCNMRCASL